MGGHHAACTQWMDLLDWIRQEVRNEGSPDPEDSLGTKRRQTPTLLLGRLHASLKNKLSPKTKSPEIARWQISVTMIMALSADILRGAPRTTVVLQPGVVHDQQWRIEGVPTSRGSTYHKPAQKSNRRVIHNLFEILFFLQPLRFLPH